jgi:hypothetical protein
VRAKESTFRFGLLGVVVCFAAICQASDESARAVAVRYAEGALHGFLTLRTFEGAAIADGELMQSSRGGATTTRLVFHFKDGSLQDETTVFSQKGTFHVISDHMVQKGPTFKRQVDLMVNGSTGQATARYGDEDGKEKVADEHLEIPPNLANGIVPILIKNLPAGAQSTTASMVVAAPKPTLVKLAINAEGEDWFVTGGARHKATRYVVKIELGGVKGVVAPLVGKQPPDSRVWVIGGSSPTFVRSEGSLCEGCPIWRMELVSPVMQESDRDAADRKK